MSELTLTVDDHPLDDGPALSCLAPQEKAFVVAMVMAGGAPNQVQNAARAAGYADPKYGWMLMRKQKIIDAIREEAGKRLVSGALVGASVLMELAMGANSSGSLLPVKPELRYKAAKELLAHAGYMPVHKQEITVNHLEPDKRQLVADIASFARQMGMDPQKLLGSVGVATDAEFTEVEESPIETVASEPWSV